MLLVAPRPVATGSLPLRIAGIARYPHPLPLRPWLIHRRRAERDL